MRRLISSLSAAMMLCTAPAWAATYYVATTGSNSNSCVQAQTDTTPKLTLVGGESCLTAAGDTLEVLAGTYTTTANRIFEVDFPVTGTAALPITVRGRAGATVVIQSGDVAVIRVQDATKQYLVFDNLILDGTGTTPASGNGAQTVYFSGTSTNITLKNSTIRNSVGHGMQGSGTNHTLLNLQVLNNGGSTGYLKNNGLYLSMSNSLISRITTSGNECYGLRLWNSGSSPAVTDNVVEYIIAHDNGSGSAVGDCDINAGGLTIGGSRNIVKYVLSYNQVIGLEVNKGPQAAADNKFYHLTLTDNTIGFSMQTAGVTGTVLSNSHIVGNDTNIYNPLSLALTQTTNRTTGSLTDCTVSTSVFTQKAGSSCIDAGTAIAGLSYNGSAPDQGAFETPIFASCVVEDGDASTLRVTFTNNAFPPLLPATGITGFTARKATVNDVITAAVRTGTNRVDLTLTDAIANGNAVDVTYSAGNLTDSALVGNETNQPFVATLTNQSCTNNVGAAASHVFTQAAFEFHGLRGTEAAPVGTPYASAPENTNILVRVGGSLRLRISVTCTTADCPPTGFFPRYSCAGCTTAGTYTVVPDTFAADEDIAFCGTSPDPDIPTSGTATTDQLSTAGAFVAGALVRTSNAIPTIDLDNDPAQKTEIEYCFSFDTDAVAARTYDFRLYQQDGTALNTYTVTPRATIAAASAGMGF